MFKLINEQNEPLNMVQLYFSFSHFTHYCVPVNAVAAAAAVPYRAIVAGSAEFVTKKP